MISDMEDLITKVRDKDIADYLSEAYRCYGASAYRACIVITNIALFEGLKRKINALAPVSSICKEISDEINPLADGQKVFETPLIHKLKSKNIITELEADRLEQINKHRNKAAHPSGHHPSAEEARFVFSEAINNFLIKDIRQTTYLVDKIIEELEGDNFFPSVNIRDMKSVVDDETKNLDDLAWPALLSKIDKSLDSTNSTISRNSQDFCLGASCKKDTKVRDHLISKIINPRLSKTKDAKLVSMLIDCDPNIIDSMNPSGLLKLDALLVHNAKECGVDNEVTKLKNPAHIASRILSIAGIETLSKVKNFKEYIVEQLPLTSGFIASLKNHIEFKNVLKDGYRKMASSSNFDRANRFSRRLPELDEAFIKSYGDQFAFEIITDVVVSAEVGAFSAINLQDTGFQAVPHLKRSALNFSKNKVTKARLILKENGINMKLLDFRKKYLTN